MTNLSGRGDLNSSGMCLARTDLPMPETLTRSECHHLLEASARESPLSEGG